MGTEPEYECQTDGVVLNTDIIDRVKMAAADGRVFTTFRRGFVTNYTIN